MPEEILRRLHEDQAGLGYPAPVSKRRLHEWIAEHREKHGPPPDPALERIEPDTIAKLKARIVALVAREIDALERKHKGKLNEAQARTLRVHYSTLNDAEKRERTAQRNRRQPSRAREAGAPGQNGSREPETALQRLEREEREAAEQANSEPAATEQDGQSAEPPKPDTIPAPNQRETEHEVPRLSVLNVELQGGELRRSGGGQIGAEAERPPAPSRAQCR